jgi:hypothetical protein
MLVTECDSAGSIVIGEESTNQETDERSCAKPNSTSSKGYISMGGKALDTKQFFKNIPYKGRGGGVTKTIHSKFSKRENTQQRSSDSNLNLNNILTPTKRKLIQKCNTGNLLKIFEAKSEVQTGIDEVGEGGGGQR